jgi:hypothetical protein
MDALALLCTLHADGPSTLKNLRQAGCGSLAAIESMEEERLSQVLGAPAAVARRFVREARHLRERLEPGVLDREETHVDPPVDEAGLGLAPDPAGPAATPEPFDLAARLEMSNVVPPSRLTPVEDDRDPMAEVLEAWRDRDEVEASAPAEAAPTDPIDPIGPIDPIEAQEDEAPPRPVRARPEFEFGAEVVAAMRDLTSTIPQEVPMPVGAREPLVEGLSALIEGQESELALRLGREGIADLRELTDADVLELSERFGFGYTRILRLVQLARRAASGMTKASGGSFGAEAILAEGTDASSMAPTEPETVPKLSPADRPRSARPSILELEWNLEIQPQPPHREHALPDTAVRDARHEGAGGPFA